MGVCSSNFDEPQPPRSNPSSSSSSRSASSSSLPIPFPLFVVALEYIPLRCLFLGSHSSGKSTLIQSLLNYERSNCQQSINLPNQNQQQILKVPTTTTPSTIATGAASVMDEEEEDEKESARNSGSGSGMGIYLSSTTRAIEVKYGRIRERIQMAWQSDGGLIRPTVSPVSTVGMRTAVNGASSPSLLFSAFIDTPDILHFQFHNLATSISHSPSFSPFSSSSLSFNPYLSLFYQCNRIIYCIDSTITADAFALAMVELIHVIQIVNKINQQKRQKQQSPSPQNVATSSPSSPSVGLSSSSSASSDSLQLLIILTKTDGSASRSLSDLLSSFILDEPDSYSPSSVLSSLQSSSPGLSSPPSRSSFSKQNRSTRRGSDNQYKQRNGGGGFPVSDAILDARLVEIVRMYEGKGREMMEMKLAGTMSGRGTTEEEKELTQRKAKEKEEAERLLLDEVKRWRERVIECSAVDERDLNQILSWMANRNGNELLVDK